MADVHSPEIRSKNMKAIRNHDTYIEIKLNAMLEDLGFEFQKQVKELPGKPDFVIEKYRKIIFTHGCFWHKHNCHLFKPPATRTDFWMKKIGKNVVRDRDIYERLRDGGWHVMIIWECSIKGRSKLSPQQLLDRVEEWVCAGDYSAEIDTSGMHKKLFKPSDNSQNGDINETGT
ncbi:very short patch repair endonuclease [Pectobacterium sp. CHL-2024]|uniref:very short patch repair endonuclease n=1 Tax=Pectobacterium sp. CHL-2024 TaxID=3377079 RepID=UPI00382CA7E3